jgi:alpha-glucuronidase
MTTLRTGRNEGMPAWTTWGCCLALLFAGAFGVARAEDGHELWLRYRPMPASQQRILQRELTGLWVAAAASPMLQSALSELSMALPIMSGRPLRRAQRLQPGALVLGLGSDPLVASLGLGLAALGDEGYLLRHLRIQGKPVTLIAANTPQGLLYGSFALLGRLQQGRSLTGLDERSVPRIRLRMLNHWDNLDGHVERGYAGASLWDWWRLPDVVDPLYRDYARANASIGINAAVLNNVNAAADILRPEYIAKTRALADALRPWGLRVFLSVRFSSPMELGGLGTADPLDAAVRAWWKSKAAELYAAIPDFGGFLVKANSEGQPGPMDYGRTHADGANAIAEALQPHGGVVLWRAFVYSERDATDRAMQAYRQLQPLDGAFADNVVLQVKNGPVDFQPREPFHPLFGAMPRTATGLEVQITKEYLGFATHLAYLGPLYEEVLRADTGRPGAGTVSRVIEGRSLHTGVMAGVANTGRDRNWTGSQFDQANWYVFGRMAWNPEEKAHDIAREWVGRTFAVSPEAERAIVEMMMESREAVVDYMTPLGLAHLMGTGHHHGPAPWVSELSRPEWNPVYYHRADADGIGFDRTIRGSNALSQYAPAVAARFADPARAPLEHLLWFHHVGWQTPLSTGRTVWEELIHRYDRGVAKVARWQRQWAGLAGQIDTQRHQQVAATLAVQAREARWWRDASIAYWQHLNGLSLPAGAVPPEHPLAHYQALQFPYAPGR